ncbi:MAG: carboxypeptidase-like regulatory domain-containing protein [Saprospiraceae bacterium]
MANLMHCIKIFAVIILLPYFSISQVKTITIVENNSNEPLIGVNVSHGSTGYVTDENGQFVIKVNELPINLYISYVGYQSQNLIFQQFSDLPETIELAENIQALDLVTVTGSKYEQNITKSTVSVDIIKPDLLRSVNATGSDKILNKVPYVQLDDKPIYVVALVAHGAGSRVILLLDDMPALQPDQDFQIERYTHRKSVASGDFEGCGIYIIWVGGLEWYHQF